MKEREQVLQVHHQRPAAVERHHVGAERRLQRGEAVELVEHHVRHRVAPHFDHDAEAVAVGFVAQRRDPFDLLVAHQFADALDQMRLVHLIGNLGNDDRFALAAQRLEFDLAAHDDRAAAEMIGGADALPAENDAAGREIRTRHDARSDPRSTAPDCRSARRRRRSPRRDCAAGYWSPCRRRCRRRH